MERSHDLTATYENQSEKTKVSIVVSMDGIGIIVHLREKFLSLCFCRNAFTPYYTERTSSSCTTSIPDIIFFEPNAFVLLSPPPCWLEVDEDRYLVKYTLNSLTTRVINQ